jgi:hypothetical protein
MPDSGTPTDAGDASVLDAPQDVSVDTGANDATADADATAPQTPALWSKGFSSTTFRGLRSDTLLLVDYSAGADVGTGALTGSGCIGVVVSGANGAVVPQTPVMKQPGCSCWDGAHDSTTGSVVDAICSSGPQIGCLRAANTGVPAACFQSQTESVTTSTRTHSAGVGTNAVITIDSTSGTNFPNVDPKQLGAISLNDIFTWYGTVLNTNSAAIDTVIEPLTTTVWIYGRQDGTSYDYSMTGASTPTNGGGFFWAKYDSKTFSVQSIKQFGGTPLKAASDKTSDTDEGIAASIANGVGKGCATFAYTGTTDLGTGPKTATSASHSIILSNLFNGTATFVASYDKGPSAQGKTSTPHCAVNTAGDIYLVDTIWDWIDIAGTKVMAIHANGDVLVAKISANGTLAASGVYGGGGAVKGSGVLVTASVVIVGGQSANGIDFGNGSLSAGAFIAGFAP